MRNLFVGVLLIIVIGIGGLVYRNSVEHPSLPITCSLDSKMCPDGTSVTRSGPACTFAECPPPNVAFPDVRIAFALPEGFVAGEAYDAATIAAYEKKSASSMDTNRIIIRRYAVGASSTPLATIQETAIGGASGLPAPATFSSSVIGTRRFTIVSLERFEGVVDTAYYLARGTDVLRFDAIDAGVTDWMDPALDTTTLPTQAALVQLLSNLQVL
jgi:hypothetical protein